MNILLGYIITYTYIISVILLTSILKNKNKLREETSRKLIHIFVGFSWFIMSYFFNTSWHILIPPLTFIIINYLSYKKNIIPSMERENNKSKGTIYYALSFSILSLISLFKKDFLPYYGLGVIIMAISDGLAPFIGSKAKQRIGNTSKTYMGSLFILISSVIITLVFNSLYLLEFNLIDYLIIGLSSSLLEIFDNGYDNLTLPIGIALISYFL